MSSRWQLPTGCFVCLLASKPIHMKLTALLYSPSNSPTDSLAVVMRLLLLHLQLSLAVELGTNRMN